ncbi:MAG: FixH family protein [Chloroflexota bacterium]
MNATEVKNATNSESNQAAITSPATGPRAVRSWQLIGAGAALLLVLLGIIFFLVIPALGGDDTGHNANTPPPDLDTSLTQTSTKGLYRGTAAPGMAPIAINQLHSWTLHVETADGRPVDDATIAVKGDMPGHGHGLPTEPKVNKAAGAGNYLVEGMKFQMTGWWYLDFTIASSKGSDTVRFNLVLK